MNKFLATVAVLSITASAWAQQPPQPGRDRPNQAGMEEMRAKMQQRMQENFKKADKDGDGALSRAEVDAGMPRMAKDFDAIDANKDGKITQDEMRAFGEKRRAEMQSQRSGQGGQGGRRPDPERMKQHFAEEFKKADTDGDGMLSRAEAEKSMPGLAQHFDQIDANKDGKLTQDEIRASMEKRHAEMEKHRGERKGPAVPGPDGKN
jgi:Ca2+-binding EF-hand superfamily protein